MTRIEKEKQTINLMINLYCKKKHKYKNGLCEDCNELLEYAHKRLDFCKFGNEKSFCSKCPIHCYKKDMKANGFTYMFGEYMGIIRVALTKRKNAFDLVDIIETIGLDETIRRLNSFIK